MTEAAAESFEDWLVARGVLPRPPANAGVGSGRIRHRSLLERAGIEPRVFAAAMAEYYKLPRACLEDMRKGQPLVGMFSHRFLREAGLFPYETESGELRLAIADHSDPGALRAMELTLGRPVVREVAAFDDLDSILRNSLSILELPATEDRQTADQWPSGDGDDLDSLRDLASGAPVVRAVADLLERAVEQHATDIHIEPFRGTLQIRLRVDGLLRPVPPPPAEMARAIISRVKILAGLNITERRLPQDGRTRVRVGSADIDVRVATMPTASGEAAVLRLLERNPRLSSLSRLGLGERDRTLLERHLASPHGLVIVTGPTGGGKTTTLASALSMLNQPHRKILTIEDPIEYEIAGINQSQVRPAVGLTFLTALRSFLRQDPDVIMVGEMRDGETAKVGVQAALTGHLVLTTLHTNSAAAAVTRLLDMGVESYLLGSTLRCIVGQRLVRVLCPDCCRATRIASDTFKREPRAVMIGLKHGDSIAEPVGCERCSGSGYRGRLGIFEVLDVSDPIRSLIGSGANDAAIEQQARAEGMTIMLEDARAKCLAGLTSIDEILRVTAV
jgi:general secretion pathway protein E